MEREMKGMNMGKWRSSGDRDVACNVCTGGKQMYQLTNTGVRILLQYETCLWY